MLSPERRAAYTRAQLEPLIAPRSIAVVGASPRAGAFGMRTLENLAQYAGEVFPVNAKYEVIGERRCYASLAALPHPPDCAVLVVPREGVERSLEEAAAAGAGSAIVFASGYGEMAHDDAARAQRRLAAIARAAAMPLLGPNCMGLVNHVLRAGVTFLSEYARAPRTAGSIAIVSQSGALGYSLAQAWDRGVGIRYFFSCGNSADVDVGDLVAAMAEDPEVRAIACLFEGAASAARLRQAGERAHRAGKPVIVFKLGASADGAAAARSHTGSLAGSAVAWRALFDRAGFVAVEDFDALLEYTRFFAAAGEPSARGAAVISGSGGAGVMAADKAAAQGVPMPQPLPATVDVLRGIVPEFGAARNPCDPTAQVLNVPDSFGRCCRALLDDPQYGVLVIPATVAIEQTALERVPLMARLAREQPKPVAMVWLSEWLQGPGAPEYEKDERIAVFRSMERCFAAIAAWHARADRKFPPAPRRAPARAAQEAKALLAAAGATLTEREAKRVLAAYGVPVVAERLARSADEAAAAARELGYPVVMKAEAPGILHKTELDVVRLDIGNEDELRPAYAEIVAAALGHELHGVLVQPMVPGAEVIVGARIDPAVGPVVVVGSGGVLVELIHDTVAALAPVSTAEARAMLARLRGYPLLTGFRGGAPADLDALADAIARVSELAADLAGEIEELDVNPLRCGPQQVAAVDALITRRA
ncbi:MAG: acetate--CoA ligase family protein [Betaproteobacteria bacterium]|nr:acetate--CoA ligase family protein [Betaproteobacteria bacterium]